jgi:hypothetical protein
MQGSIFNIQNWLCNQKSEPESSLPGAQKQMLENTNSPDGTTSLYGVVAGCGETETGTGILNHAAIVCYKARL